VAVTPQRSGVMIRGAVRDIMVLQRGKNKIVVIAKNNEEVEIIQ
jgi:ribosomal protein L30E